MGVRLAMKSLAKIRMGLQSIIGVSKNKYVLGLCLLTCIFFYQTDLQAVESEKSSKARYNDFYRHKAKVKKQNQERKQGKSAQRALRKKEEARYEKARQNYIRQRQNEMSDEERHRRLKAWEQKRKEQEQQKREAARKKYSKSKQQQKKYEIPENIEFDINPPPLDLETSRSTRNGQGSRSLLAPQGSGRSRF